MRRTAEDLHYEAYLSGKASGKIREIGGYSDGAMNDPHAPLIAFYPLVTTCCLLRAAHCLLPAAHFLLLSEC